MPPDGWDADSWAVFIRALRGIELLLPQLQTYVLNADALPAVHALHLIRLVRDEAEAACGVAAAFEE